MNVIGRVMICLLMGMCFIHYIGCSGDSLWSPPEKPNVPSNIFEMDRAEEDFEQGANWTGIYGRPDLWTLVVRSDRPQGDGHVFTNIDTETQQHIAIWNEVELLSNPGSHFAVLGKTEEAKWMGVVINYQPDGSFYLFRVQPVTSLWEIQRVSPFGVQVIAGGVAEDDGNLILPNEYIRLQLGWSQYEPNLLEASIVSPAMGVHQLASLTIPLPLVGGKVGVYAQVDGVFFDDAKLSGRTRIALQPSITVHADRQTGKISDKVFGVNFIWRGGNNGIPATIYDELQYKSEISDWFRLLNTVYPIGLSSTRYPGGLEALLYFWKHGVGPASSRGNPNDLDTITVGTDEFLQFTEEMGADAVITLNPTFSYLPVGDPAVAQYAADWVEYCNAPNDGSNPGGGVDFAALRAINGHEAPYRVKYWEIGNEIGGLTTTELAEIIRSISDATRRIDPSIELGFQDHVFSEPYNRNPFSPEAKGYYTNPQGTGILDLANDAFDFWQPHPYGPSITEIGPALFQNGATLTASHYFSSPGRYQLVLRGYCQNPTPDPIRSHRYGTLTIKLNGSTIGEFEVASVSERDWVQEATINIPGTYAINIEGDNLIQNRVIYLTNRITVINLTTSEEDIIDLTNSEEVYGIMQATAPHVDYVYYGLFKDFFGGKPIYPTEWNTTTGFYDAPNDLKWALSNGDYLDVFIRNGTFLTSFWDLSAKTLLVGLVEGILEGYADPRLRPTAYVFQLYKNLLKGDGLEIDTRSPFYLRGIDGVRLGVVGSLANLRIPYLSAIASLSPSKESLSLIVINKHRNTSIPADITIEGFRSSGYGMISVFDADKIDANNERGTCPDPGECVKTVTSLWHGATSQFTYVFPPHSITAFTMYASRADLQPPAPPSNLSAEAIGTSVHLRWSPSQGNDVIGYNLYRSRWPDGPYGHVVNSTLIESTEYIDENLDPAVTFYYAATAVDRVQKESAFSNKVAGRIAGNLPTAYYPIQTQMLLGTPDGNIQALMLGDYSVERSLDGDSFYRVRSLLGSTDWVLTMKISENPGAVSRLAIFFQALYSVSGSQEFFLWNVVTNKWDSVRATTVHGNQIERYMEVFTESSFLRNHISDNGILQLRVAAPLGGQFTCYADYCAIVVR